MVNIRLIPFSEFQRIREAPIDRDEKLSLIADMCRANALAIVKRAGSGHLGSSFSSLDIVTLLYYDHLNIVRVGLSHPDRDIYFSSKGHDCPGLYAVLLSLGILSKDRVLNLRRLGGVPGHPDVRIPGIEANTGSLGMGISKAKGIAMAKQLRRQQGDVFVMTGDGEWQEGQVYEALQTAAHQRVTNLHVIVDHNTVQSDMLVREIIDLGDLEAKCRAFGWHVARCSGHDVAALKQVLEAFRVIRDRPKLLIADTVKGRGVSFMEHEAALRAGHGVYRWHAGAPDDQAFGSAHEELTSRINAQLNALGCAPLTLEAIPPDASPSAAGESESVSVAFGQALLEAAGRRDDLIVLDADLAADCQLRACAVRYPQRFIENGIAEQDMVSMAGGLALQGWLPVVNTFANFLAARANEQIANNASEQTKIIYVCHYAGLLPAGPGASHQSVRDIALLGGLPNVVLIQPCNAAETRMALDYCVDQAKDSCVLRLLLGPSPGTIHLPSHYRLTPGQGVVLTDGTDGVLFAYGPVMLHEALAASHRLSAVAGVSLKVVNMPWLNQVDPSWLEETLEGCPALYVLEDHAPFGGLADTLLRTLAAGARLAERPVIVFGVEGHPACGTAQQALQYHKLDGASLASRLSAHLTKSRPGRMAGVGALRSAR
ncbi:MAG: 1-deoxy-D-xylulose-5-phosphate synthase [Candidatus Omnitrophica bacterium]|nr:1-deoxy-D-xylulose-5-phosphate synthase [Candidatus Omnitrophota bacterium]